MTPRFRAYSADADTVAQRLLGQRLVRVINGRRLAGPIVEVEAYLGARDKAAHTFGGRRTARNASMYLGGGHAYIYFTYGMHHCLNVVCGKPGDGVAVLLRAVEPTEGLELMFRRRVAAREVRDLCSGPGKLTQALGIDKARYGHPLSRKPLWIYEDGTLPGKLVKTTRVGISQAKKQLYRYLDSSSDHISKPPDGN